MRLGMFGGEFDPPHLGHLAVARTAVDQLRLDRLIVVPTARPPHRAASETPAGLRLLMAELAFADEPKVEVSRIELDRSGGPSYTVDTLRSLAPLGELWLIVGADQDIRSWHEAAEILRLAHIAVAPRGEHPVTGAVELEMAPVDLSSTGVRTALAAGAGEQAVDPAVLDLIRREGLYAGAAC